MVPWAYLSSRARPYDMLTLSSSYYRREELNCWAGNHAVMTWKCFCITGPLCGESSGFPSQRASNAKLYFFVVGLNKLLTVDSPHKWPVMQNFDDVFIGGLCKLLNRQFSSWSFEMTWYSHGNDKPYSMPWKHWLPVGLWLLNLWLGYEIFIVMEPLGPQENINVQ